MECMTGNDNSINDSNAGKSGNSDQEIPWKNHNLVDGENDSF